MLHRDFDPLISQRWQAQTPVHVAMDELAEHLDTWSKEVFGNLFRVKRKIWGRIQGIQGWLAEGGPHYLLKLEQKLWHQLDDVLQQIELFWFQKSRLEYIRDRVRNTCFYHLSTIVRRRLNRIEGLQRTDGTWAIESEELKALMVDYYKELYTDDTTSIRDVGRLEHLFPNLTSEHEAKLSKPAYDPRRYGALSKAWTHIRLGTGWVSGCIFPTLLGSSGRRCYKSYIELSQWTGYTSKTEPLLPHAYSEGGEPTMHYTVSPDWTV